MATLHERNIEVRAVSTLQEVLQDMLLPVTAGETEMQVVSAGMETEKAAAPVSAT